MLRQSLVFGSAVALVVHASLWHHVRVRQFLESVLRQLDGRLPPALRRHDADLATSVFRLNFSRGELTYQFRIRHKARLLELSAEVRKTNGESKRAAQLLSERLAELKARVSPNIEIEEPSRTRVRVLDVIPLNPDMSQPISRSLTDEVATGAAEQMGRFIRAIESVLGDQAPKGRP